MKAQKKKEYEGLVTKATQDKLTIAQDAQAYSTSQKTKYETAQNEYVYYFPGIIATWLAQKTYYGETTPKIWINDFIQENSKIVGQEVPTTPGMIAALFQN